MVRNSLHPIRRTYVYPFRLLRMQCDPSSEVFAKAVYDPAKPCVEAVLDSSRYFVIRVEDNGRRAYIGMGFLERTDSFDFSTSPKWCPYTFSDLNGPPIDVALQDYTK